MNINQILPQPLSSDKKVLPKVMVTILRKDVHSFFGHVISETTTGYKVIWDASNGNTASHESGEWFAKDAPLVSCKLMN